jgi:hypothetical protein
MKIRLLFSFLLIGFLVRGQEICIDNNPLLNHLYNDTNSISAIDNFDIDANPKFLPINDKHVAGYRQRLIKSKKYLYIQIDATGRVYQATGISNEKICFTRLDSTYHIGYNGDQIVFEQNDTLFALGGQGFWRINGQLRYYSIVHNEWNILKINKELPTLNEIYHMKEGNTKIYYLQTPYIDPATGETHSKYIVTLMDVLNRKNTELGELNPILTKKFPYPDFEKRLFNSPKLNGTFVSFDRNNTFLFDFENNAAFRLINNNIKDVFYGKSNGTSPVQLFESGDSIYYCSSTDTTHKLYSFPISRNDFTKEEYPLFIPYNGIEKKLIVLFSILFSLVALILVILYIRKKQSTTNLFEENIQESNSSEIEFNPIEFELLKKMVTAQNGSKSFSAEDINAALGLGKKTIEIQKKVRTETINRINHKYKIIFNLKNDLIERVRLEEDRRYYMYTINTENKQILLSAYKEIK